MCMIVGRGSVVPHPPPQRVSPFPTAFLVARVAACVRGCSWLLVAACGCLRLLTSAPAQLPAAAPAATSSNSSVTTTTFRKAAGGRWTHKLSTGGKSLVPMTVWWLEALSRGGQYTFLV